MTGGYLFSISIVLALPVILLWVTYKFALSRKNMPQFNRSVLMGGYLCLMLFGMAYMTSVEGSVTSNPTCGKEQSHLATTLQYGRLDNNSIRRYTHWYEKESGDRVSEERAVRIGMLNLTFMIYLAGVAVVGFLTLASLVKMLLIVAFSKRVKTEAGTVFLTKKKRVNPFSFGGIIVINREDFERDGHMIVCHEKGHVECYHTFDMVMAQLFAIACWWNPAAWFIRNELKAIHEFQADEYAIDKGVDPYSYQMLLLGMKGARRPVSAIVNNMNYSNLKKRFTMMNSARMSGMHRLFVLVPVAATVVGFLLSCSKPVAEVADDAVVPAETLSAILSGRNDQNNSQNDYYLFVINGADMNSEVIANGDFIDLKDISSSLRPDSSYDGFILPKSKAVFTWRKNILLSLAGEIDTYIIDGKKSTKADFNQLQTPGKRIQSAVINGKSLEITTRLHDDTVNPALEMAVDEEMRLSYANSDHSAGDAGNAANSLRSAETEERVARAAAIMEEEIDRAISEHNAQSGN